MASVLSSQENNSSMHMDYEAEIARLKREMNAVILAHFYQESEIQDLADFVGDSLQLAQQAAKTQADVIVFCGVLFMAETAKILNPNRLVLLPDLKAGCSLADGCPAPLFRAFRERYPDHVAISYINCSAEVKAASDIICTSSNAEKIIGQIPEDQPILFAPDRHLGAYLQKKTGRPMRLWQGSCLVHEMFNERSIVELRREHPGALVLAHPECSETVLRHADYIGSTTGILRFATENPAAEFIVATEAGILHQMQKACPTKRFLAAPGEGGCSCNLCPHMRLNTLEKLYRCMQRREPEIVLDEPLRVAALQPIQRMLAMS
jgi:quinolinate synthase